MLKCSKFTNNDHIKKKDKNINLYSYCIDYFKSLKLLLGKKQEQYYIKQCYHIV